MIARTVYRSALTALLLGLVGAALLAALPRSRERLLIQAGDIGPFLADGETARLRNFFGFYDPESAGATRFRWTTGEGSFVVRSGANMGAPLVLALRICGCRPGEAAAPRLRLQANGETLAETAATAGWGQWRRYTLLVPPRAAPYSPDLLVELLSDHVPNAATGKPLGVAFDWAQLTPLDDSPRSYDALTALGLGLLAGGLVFVARVRGASPRAALLAGMLGLGLAAAQGALYRHQPLPAGTLALGLLVGLGLALALGDSPATTGGLALLLGALVLAAQFLGTWMLDDAFISFRYARNALLGHGFVFNPGERVEGYTNFLWTALFVPILGAGADPVPIAQAISLLLALTTVALTWVGARRMGGRIPALTAVALLAACAPFVLYTARGSGMETALFTFLLLGGVLAFLDERAALAGVLLALAAMTRPEGALVAAVSGVYLVLESRRAGRVAWRQLAALAAGFLTVFAPYYLWRVSYYGYLLPNTFYAKVGGTLAQAQRGLDYAAGFGASQVPLIALLLLPIVSQLKDTKWSSGLPDSWPQRWSAGGYLWALVGVYTLYIVIVGGDHFPLYRFFVPLMPLLTLLAARALQGASSALLGRAAVPAMALIAAAGIAWQFPQLYQSRTLNTESQVWGENSVVEKNREIGRWFREHTPPGTLIATGIAGALPYYAERPVLDSLGLNDLHIAHLDVPAMGQGIAGSEKTDVAYVLGRRPAYIPHNSSGPFKSDPTFRATYESMVVRGPEGRGLQLYRRADLPMPETTLGTSQGAVP